MIIGLAGKARSGKDTAADGLVDDGWVRRGFADKLREAALLLDPLVDCHETWDTCETERLSEAVQRMGWDEAKYAYPEIRLILQRLGTDVVRNVIGDSVWVNLAMQYVVPNTVFSDVRFPNEADAIRELGGIIVEIIRPNNQYQTTHDSELLDFPKDEQIVNNGTIPELQTALKIIAASHTTNT